MAKPILVVDVNFDNATHFDKIVESLRRSTDDEYHVIVRGVSNYNSTIQCFNDCKGLPDIDIEKMINELMIK